MWRGLLKGLVIVITALYASYSFAATIFDFPTIKNQNVGLLVAFAAFVFVILWHFWDLQQEIKGLKAREWDSIDLTPWNPASLGWNHQEGIICGIKIYNGMQGVWKA